MYKYKWSGLLVLVWLVSTPGLAQFSFFSNEYKEKYETERQKGLQMSQDNQALKDSIRSIISLNGQLRRVISTLESNQIKLEERLLQHNRENKRVLAQLGQLKKDTASLQGQIRTISGHLVQVEQEGKQQSARLEKQLYVLKDSLKINTSRYQQSHQELTKIQSLVSMIKIGDMEFSIPPAAFSDVLHKALASENTKLSLHTEQPGKVTLIFKTSLREKRFLGYREVPYRVEAYLSYFAHPYYSSAKTILTVYTRSFRTNKNPEVEVNDFEHSELLKRMFYEELERVNDVAAVR
ncbi:hypothetical protein GCM10027275_39210 [Rhabdobacter roseus]|uniref:Uncharacterized protein n=1 Tax=Rhabdobacter roseus TaxID=1655419 RepID=A0A840TMY3_9BACT|nr:hypothetical protein [Rhabdobacter roseus]MBB5285626.1 hypothetical protein [Rhabdobacter roseus]